MATPPPTAARARPAPDGARARPNPRALPRATRASVRRALAHSWRVSPGFTLLTAVNLVALPPLAVAAATDPTTLDGAPLWAKPLKFALSFLALGPAMTWIYSRVRRTRAVRAALEVAAGTMLLEMVLIVGQALRGRASHFNNETALDAAVFTVMAPPSACSRSPSWSPGSSSHARASTRDRSPSP